MAVYVIVEVSFHDQQGREEYQKIAPATVFAFDGKFLVRGGKTTVLEGNWNPERIVMLEFPTAERALEWWNSELYAEAKAIRQKSGATNLVILQGI